MHPERHVREVEVEAHERVLAAAGPRDGTTLRGGARRSTEERLEDVLEPEPAAHAATGLTAGRASAGTFPAPAAPAAPAYLSSTTSAAAQSARVHGWATDTWRSLVAMTHPKTGLPADNIAESLAPGDRSGYTSPTNIGGYLWSAVVARELGITQANASYHLRTLRAAGLLVVGSEESVRGGQAKRYRHPWDAPEPGEASGDAPGEDAADPDADATEADEEARLAYVTTLAAAVPARFAERQTGTGGVFTDADLWVEPVASPSCFARPRPQDFDPDPAVRAAASKALAPLTRGAGR